ncbi:MAG: FHA domain-containing protein [Lachnospiraceae bacterium]|nr:FHA domain-containing protein [Lachnospiraceae bacterium]
MECMMPNREYERTMNHTYLILEKCNYFGEEEEKADYRKRMLLENTIPGLLPVKLKSGNDSSRYYYEVNSLETLDKLYEETEISYEQLQKLLIGVIRLFESLEEYLLEGTQIIMRPEYIYLEPERMEPYFICYPDYEGDIRKEFVELVDYVLAKIDHTDERAVMLGYQVYRYTRNPNYVLSEIHQMLRLAGEAEQVNVPSNRRYTPEDELLCDSKEMAEEKAFEFISQEKQEETLEVSKQPKAVRISIGIAIVACLFFAVEYMLGIFGLSGIQMVYVCGVAALSCMVAGILYYGNRKQAKKSIVEQESMLQATMFTEERAVYDAGTVCLTKDMVKSYFATPENSLVGVVNGEEIKYSLQRFPLTIGKQEGVSDLIISDNTVSRCHARLEQIDGRVYITDMNSTNGTIKNGKLLAKDELSPLEAGDQILLGNVSFTFS